MQKYNLSIRENGDGGNQQKMMNTNQTGRGEYKAGWLDEATGLMWLVSPNSPTPPYPKPEGRARR